MTANQINYARHREEQRHNQETESQGRQSLTETSRHNRVSEAIGYGGIGATYAQIAESRRHNQEQEAINWFTAQNLGYLQGEQGGYYRAAAAKAESEVGVQDKKVENDYRLGVVGLIQQGSQNIETVRHNLASESVSRQDAATRKQQADIQQQQADVAKDKAQSEKFRNYGSGVRSFTDSFSTIADTIGGIANGSKFKKEERRRQASTAEGFFD